jgi:mannose-1-phosphate guanylyltransferase / mannose-6-phosphate isomerase
MIKKELKKIYPVILSGGVGSRLWPISRESHPKPFMQLPDGQSLLQKTFLRAAALPGCEEVMTVTNRELYFKSEDEYKAVNQTNHKLLFLLEPFGRNTAAAVAAAALEIAERHGPEALMLALAADHLIADTAGFNQAVAEAMQIAEQGWLVTFGIRPDYPETGFGYIEADPAKPLSDSGNAFCVQRFVEKPDLATYYWNSGMFCFKVGKVIEELQAFVPELLASVKQVLAVAKKADGDAMRLIEFDAEHFAQVPDISFDYAIMERSAQVATLTCNIGWSDIGSWNAVGELSEQDENGNRVSGEATLFDVKNSYVQSPDRLAALVGVENLIVVDTPDALLVAHRDRVQDVKHIVSQLKKSGHETHKLHRTVHRPWGTYTVLQEAANFKIKRIEVKPGGKLSLQMHHHRSEHWVVVSGTARVTNDDQMMLINTNESTYISAGHKHRLENPGVIPLIMIEVQSGDYVGEDDIVRFDDQYGRC